MNKSAAFLMGEVQRYIKLFQSSESCSVIGLRQASLDIEARIRVEIPSSTKGRLLLSCNYVAYNPTSFEDDMFVKVR
jgi:hypothetical protein